MPKYLFVFNDKTANINCEVFAKDMLEAQEKVCKILGIPQINSPVYFTENFDCPRCRVIEHECHYPE